eukprot:TRINITY_DN1266_c0_g1_i14.p1 TRINITY_DN1266_c0_g1~~TRINITY_DN1266_c0_g1_i14.p1  ORF type:complete len:173 (+),score=21.44 TRINITY_DN1266_c0_g1_i14:106-624(+)
MQPSAQKKTGKGESEELVRRTSGYLSNWKPKKKKESEARLLKDSTEEMAETKISQDVVDTDLPVHKIRTSSNEFTLKQSLSSSTGTRTADNNKYNFLSSSYASSPKILHRKKKCLSQGPGNRFISCHVQIFCITPPALLAFPSPTFWGANLKKKTVFSFGSFTFFWEDVGGW